MVTTYETLAIRGRMLVITRTEVIAGMEMPVILTEETAVPLTDLEVAMRGIAEAAMGVGAMLAQMAAALEPMLEAMRIRTGTLTATRTPT